MLRGYSWELIFVRREESMALVGTLHEFSPEEEEWTHYAEQLSEYFIGNAIAAAEKKRAILLSSVGARTYKLLSDLVSPDAPRDKTFDELCQVLKEHYKPREPVMVSRFNFNKRNRKENETVTEYVRELRRLAKECQYGNQLNNMLRDRLAVGVNDEAIQKRLLSETEDLTFDKALKLALSIEQASTQVQRIRSDEQRVNRIRFKGPGKAIERRNQPAAQSERRSAAEIQCFCCGAQGHVRRDCKHQSAVCDLCHKVGHLKRMCFQRQQYKQQKKSRNRKQGKTNAVTDATSSESAEDFEYTFTVGERSQGKAVTVPLSLDGMEVQFEVDTGASRTLISEKTYKQLKLKGTLKETHARLLSYTDEEIPVKGSVQCRVNYRGQQYTLPLLVVQGNGRSLLGRNWMESIKLDWNNIFSVTGSGRDVMADLQEEFAELFAEGLGRYRGPPVKIYLNHEVQPIFLKARSVPFAMRQGIEECLEKEVKEGTLEAVEHSRWACPVVPVVKPDNTIRLCGDYKLTVNRAVKVDKYPLPTISDLYAKLTGGVVFTKLDLSQAYHQVVVDEESREALTINTHRGLFRPTRLPFGLSSSPGVFQRIMDGLLAGLPGVCVYLDDIIVTGRNQEEHQENVRRVLQKLKNAGFKLKKKKCAFGVSSVTYLGHQIDAQGLHTLPDKVEAVAKSPEPSNVTELRSFLGMLNHYRSFLPQAAATLEPLNRLLRKDTSWHWGPSQQKAFESAKALLTSSQVLMHFDPKLPLVLECDASSKGIGAVLAHVTEAGERPIAYASRSLNAAEVGYAQIEREALGIVFGVKKFHKMLYGHQFTLKSDHKPLLYIFGEHKGVPPMASARLQRWALMLSAYTYHMEFKRGKELCTADALSRLPMTSKPERIPVPTEVANLIRALDESIVTAKQIAVETRRDPVLSRVLHWILDGWSENPGPHPGWRHYTEKKEELTVQSGCVLWGSRVVVPPKLRQLVLDMLHETHQGASRMKGLARQYFWWPAMDREIEYISSACKECAQQRNDPAAHPLRPWPLPSGPWRRLHIDHAGPFQGQLYLIVVDAYSKWLEVKPVANTSSATTIRTLQSIFSTHGLPKVLVSDNASGFKSEEFSKFLRKNGIEMVNSPPYHPKSNGLAERAVQHFKKAMKKLGGDPLYKLNKWLFEVRATPHATTGQSPAELLMNRRLRTRWNAMIPDIRDDMERKQEAQKRNHDRRSRVHQELGEGDKVWWRHYGDSGTKWEPGVVQRREEVTFDVEPLQGPAIRRHAEQLSPRTDSPREDSSTTPVSPSHTPPVAARQASPATSATSSEVTVSPSLPIALRKAKRSIVAPRRLGYE